MIRRISRLVGFPLAAWIAAGASCLGGEPVNARIARFAGDRAAAISYTFDDNIRDQYTLAVPMLNEVGFKGTFFVIAGKTAETPEEGNRKAGEENVRENWGGISWPELKEMSDQGHEIASHTWSHRGMSKLTPEEVETELAKAGEEIHKRIGKPALTIAFPFNQSTPEVESTAMKYHVAFRDGQLGTSGKSTVENLNRWADKLVRDGKSGVVMIHAVAKGYAAFTDPEILRTHLKQMKARQEEIWVDTFANVARYEKERDDSKLSVTGTKGRVTCVLTCSMDPNRFEVPLTVVIEAAGAKAVRAERSGETLPARVERDRILVDAAPANEPITIQWN